MKRVLALATVCLLAAGCLLKKTTHTLYLETNGTVTWTVLDADVRSDEESRANRLEEEAGFLDRVRRGEHPPIRVFDHLGASSLDSRFLRHQRPYTLLTEGRFSSIDSLIRTLLDETGLPAEVDLDSWYGWSRLTVTIDVWALEQMEGLEETPFTEALEELLTEADDFQILLAEGQFVDALNFSIEDGGTRAVPDWLDDVDSIETADGYLRYCLMWTENADPDEREVPPLPACSRPE